MPPDEQLVAPRAQIGGRDGRHPVGEFRCAARPAQFQVGPRHLHHLPGEMVAGRIALAGGDDDIVAGDFGRQRPGGAAHHRRRGRSQPRGQPPCAGAQHLDPRAAAPRDGRQRLFHRQAPAQGGHGAAPQSGIGHSDIRPQGTAKRHDLRAHGPGGQVDGDTLGRQRGHARDHGDPDDAAPGHSHPRGSSIQPAASCRTRTSINDPNTAGSRPTA